MEDGRYLDEFIRNHRKDKTVLDKLTSEVKRQAQTSEGKLTAALEKAAVNTLPFAITQTDFKKTAKGNHNVPRRVLKNLNSDLETALFTFGSGDRIGIMTGDIDGDGKPLLVGIERNASMDRTPVNAIRSVYGLDNPGPWLQNQIKAGKELVLLDKEKANAFLQTYGYMASVGDGIRPEGRARRGVVHPFLVPQKTVLKHDRFGETRQKLRQRPQNETHLQFSTELKK